MKNVLIILISLVSFSGVAQKKVISHDDYDQWKQLRKDNISRTGKLVTYEIKPHKGDGYLYIYQSETEKLDSFYRSKSAEISYNEDYVVFHLTPGYDTLRTLELEKVKKNKWPKDTIVVYNLVKDTIIYYPTIENVTIGRKNNWMVFLEKNNELEPAPKKKKCRLFKKKEPEAYETEGKVMQVIDPINEIIYRRGDVTDFHLSEKGNYLTYITNMGDSSFVNILNLVTGEETKGTQGWIALEGMTYSEPETQLALFSSQDTSKVKQFDITVYQLSDGSFKTLSHKEINTSNDFTISTNQSLFFTDNDKFLYFGTAKAPDNSEQDSLLESEIPKLDIWHYKEKELHTMQLKNVKREERKTEMYIYNLNSDNYHRLSNDTLSVWPSSKLLQPYLVGFSNENYALSFQWDVNNKRDVYLIEPNFGEYQLIERGVESFDFSPKGNYFIYFNKNDLNYYAKRIRQQIAPPRAVGSTEDQIIEQQELQQMDNFKIDAPICITCDLDSSVVLIGDLNGMPMDPYPLGIVGWMNEDVVVFNTKYDVYTYDFKQNSLYNLTEKKGETEKIKYAARLFQYDSTYISYQDLYFIGFDEKTKGSHFAQLTAYGFGNEQYWDKGLVALDKAKEADKITFRTQTVIEYPELQYGNLSFENTRTISTTNPQQSDYNWASVELVKWTSYEGRELEGLVYKPENYDPNKTYPLMVYFYEMYTERYHQHYIPKPTASIIYPTEYASGDYIVFIPDIRYTPGHPAKSAYDCIMSGTDHVLSVVPNIDSTRMALQGQSWGGYQTAQLITMTNRYAAAMAGAPVSNMFSAYGGIRWGTGMNRQFQYEKTQSRIGATIWEAPELYIENSPIFHLPNVQTPLLIMHNDQDGAVPWYQGIELFTGMRRLGKPCWMLNYNGDDHNLMKDANRRDLSRRMRQFFDYYLQDGEAPAWLLYGIPAIDKETKVFE